MNAIQKIWHKIYPSTDEHKWFPVVWLPFMIWFFIDPIWWQHRTPLLVIAGQEYGTGSSRDWAAKGAALLGVKAVVAQSFERIHRSNLVGMGILPLQFKDGVSAPSLKLDGTELYEVLGLGPHLKPQQDLKLWIRRKSGAVETVPVRCRIDTPIEIEYYHHGGILSFVLRQLLAKT